MSKGRMQAGSCTAGMRREEVEALIRAANLGEEDSYIARRCLIDQVAQLDIAFEMEDKFGQGMTRSTVSRGARCHAGCRGSSGGCTHCGHRRDGNGHSAEAETV